MAEVRMPKMGDGMAEGKITSWLKHEGDNVAEGDAIAEVETDKANVEIPAEESGVLSRIIVGEGETAVVGAVIAQIGGGAQSSNGSNGAKSATGQETRKEPTGDRAPASNGETDLPPMDLRSLNEPGDVGMPDAERIKASPLARRMAQELGVDLARVAGTGPGGRIVERDIKAFAQGGASARRVAKPAPATQPAAQSRPADQPTVAPTGATVKPSRMRAAIARRTVQSVTTAPHFYATMAIDMDRASAMLRDLNGDADIVKVTVNDLIVKACVAALTKVPQVNATWTEDGSIRSFTEMNIGVAVGIDEGLVIPVVRNCERKTLRQISNEIKSLIGKARKNELKPEEFSGGTFSISNLGMMGVEEFTAIINPPEAAILAIGGIFREAVFPDESDTMQIRSRMRVTLSSDHRLLDGVIAAKFLQEVKRALEAPFSLLS